MGCSPSVPARNPDQNGNVQKQSNGSSPHHHEEARIDNRPPPKPYQHAAPPENQPAPLPPKEPTPPPPKEPTAPPPKELTPPPPKEPTPPPPKEPTPPPPKEPTTPPPKEPTPPPTISTPSESIPVKANEESVLTPEVLGEFIELEKELQKLQRMGHEEKLMLYEVELKHTEETLKMKEKELAEAKEKSLKEYEDFANFNVQHYMIENQLWYLSKKAVTAAKYKEEQEYLEAKNKEDICEKEANKLKVQQVNIQENVDNTKLTVDKLVTLQDKQTGLLENIFNGDYGSELEDKLESEVETLLTKKQNISTIHMKWISSKHVLSGACSQMAYAVSRWQQIQEYSSKIGNKAKFIMATETRNRLISAHMNTRRVAEHLQYLPYWSDEDDKNMVISINLIYNDLATIKTFHRALAWYKYYHWRFTLLLNWMEQVISTRFSVDGKRIDKEFKEKYHLLKMERLRCIKDIVKEKLNVDLDIEQFNEPTAKEKDGVNDEDDTMFDIGSGDIFELAEDDDNESEKVDDVPDAVEPSSDPTSLEAHTQQVEPSPEENLEKSSEEGEEEVKADAEIENKQEKEAEKEEEIDDGKTKAPLVKAIPLEELAPLPSTEELFGKVEQLIDAAEKGDEALEMNKLKQEQDLQERLRRRRSKRKRVQDLKKSQ